MRKIKLAKWQGIRNGILLGPLLFWLTSVCFPSSVWGFGPQQDQLQLPTGNQAPLGFLLRVAVQDMHLLGEIPVQLEITSWSGTFSADRDLIIHFETTRGSAKPAGREFHYDIPVKLTQGSSRLTQTLFLPKWSVDGIWQVSVRENGAALDGYQGTLTGMGSGGIDPELLWRESADVRYAWVLGDANQIIDCRTFFGVTVPELLNHQLLEQAPKSFQYGQPYRHFSTVSVDELPSDWRGYDNVDVWIMEAEVLKAIATKKKPQFAAICDYLIGGGTVWLLGMQDGDEIRDWFKLPSDEALAPKSTVTATANDVITQWNFRAFDSLRAGTYGSWYGRSYLYESHRPMAGFGTSGSPNQNAIPPFDANLQWLQQQSQANPIDPASFAIYSVGLGKIVQCTAENPIPGSPVQWIVMDQLTGINLVELMRRGVDPCFGDRRFFDWIVPGVAQPPVYTFIGLLIIFVIIVGPISYRKTTKMGRGYLMMFIAPALAGITTLMMFGYGLIADGLSTQGRVREITFVGTQDGRAVRYSRGAYFAGISPVDGLSFPADASVVSYDLPTVSSFYEAARSEKGSIGTVTLSDERQHFSRNFLPSRQQKQFVAYQPIENFGTLSLISAKSANGASGQPLVKNSTPLELSTGVIRSTDGNYYSFENVAPGQQIALTSVIEKEARTMLSKLYALQRPLPPAAMAGAKRRESSTVDMLARLARENVRVPRVRTQVTAGESLIENWLRQQLQLSAELPPGYFVAITDVTSDCIATKVEKLTESVHYVVGVLE